MVLTMASPLHEHVSGVSPLGEALDGAKRPKPRRATKPKTLASPINGSFVCVAPGCGFTETDPAAMARHSAKEINSLTRKINELTSLREQMEEGALSLGAFITTSQAAEIIGVTRGTVSTLCSEGVLSAAIKWHREWMVEREETEAYAKRKNRYSRATAYEIDFLRTHQGLSAQATAEHLNRLVRWVVDQRARLRRLEGEEVWPRKLGGAPRGSRQRRSTAEEIDFVRAHQGMTAREIADCLDRPYSWVVDTRCRMRKQEGEAVWPKMPGGRPRS